MPDPAVLMIEGSDFETFPVGGQLTIARSLMKVFGTRFALVGMNRGNGRTGCWTTKHVCGSSYLFFPVCGREPSGAKPLVPARLTFYLALRQFKERILSLGCKAAFVQAPEALLAVSHWNWESICYWFPGVENPLKRSRYPFAKPLSHVFDKALFRALDRVNLVLGAADEDAINALVSRSNGRLPRERLIQVPCGVDTSLFQPALAHAVRRELGIPANCTVFVSTGRINRFKGWELLLDAFEDFLRRGHNALMFFVGDGEDRSLLEAQIDDRGLDSRVKVTGFQTPSQVASYLNAANVAVFASFVEGWSVAMLEALACGKALVSTQVSGATAMIKTGQNGFIVEGRNSANFSEAMEKALRLEGAEQVSASIAARFDLTQMGERLASLWPPFRANGFAGTYQGKVDHCR